MSMTVWSGWICISSMQQERPVGRPVPRRDADAWRAAQTKNDKSSRVGWCDPIVTTLENRFQDREPGYDMGQRLPKVRPIVEQTGALMHSVKTTFAAAAALAITAIAAQAADM